jgi:hypothetical protein
VRNRVFTEEFSELLNSLGIDATKDAEVYHVAETAPGAHYYSGWFHFVGELEVSGDFAPVKFGENLVVCLCKNNALCLNSLDHLPIVQLEFRAENVPWKLDEPSPDSAG